MNAPVASSARADAPAQPHATVVFVGHHQAGKSTTIGNLVLKLGALERRTAERLERETSNRPASRYAWVLDRSRLERERSMSVDLKLCRIDVPPSLAAAAPSAAPASVDAAAAAAAGNGSAAAAAPGAPATAAPAASGAAAPAGGPPLALTLVDTPGHPDYLRNTIAGVTQADVAVLLVDSRPAVLEAPTSAAQTRDLGLLAGALANHRAMVVAINHLDAAFDADAAEQRFADACAAVSRLLKRKEGLTFVPISGYAGDNLADPSPRLGWWAGPTLVAAMASAAAAQGGQRAGAAAAGRAAAAAAAAAAGGAGAQAGGLPLRMPIIRVYKVGGIGTVAAGRVAGGSLRAGADVCLTPVPSAAAALPASDSAAAAASLVARARSVEAFHGLCAAAGAGAFVGVAVKGVPLAALRRGAVLSDAGDRPAGLAAAFTARIQVLRDPTSKREGRARQLRLGYVAIVHVHTAQAPCRLARATRLDNKGGVVEDNAQWLREGDVAEVDLVPLVPLVVEPFVDFPHMGRFAVRASVRQNIRGTHVVTPVVVAVGRVESVKRLGDQQSTTQEAAQGAPTPAAAAEAVDATAAAAAAGAESVAAADALPAPAEAVAAEAPVGLAASPGGGAGRNSSGSSGGAGGVSSNGDGVRGEGEGAPLAAGGATDAGDASGGAELGLQEGRQDGVASGLPEPQEGERQGEASSDATGGAGVVEP